MVSVGSILGGAFGLIRERPAAVAVWAVTYFVGAVALALAMGFLATGRLNLGANPYIEPVTPSLGVILGFILFYLLSLLLIVVLLNAVFRAILRPEEPGLFAMRLGTDELRMLGLVILVALASFLAMLVGQLLFLFLASFIGMIGGDGMAAGALVLILFIACVCAVIWVQVRLSLIFPLSFQRRRITIDAAWELTRGRFWTLFGAYLTLALLIFAVSLAWAWILMGDYFAALWAAQGDPVGTQRAALEFAQRQEAMPLLPKIAMMAGSTALFAVALALGPGALASATRELLAERDGDEAPESLHNDSESD